MSTSDSSSSASSTKLKHSTKGLESDSANEDSLIFPDHDVLSHAAQRRLKKKSKDAQQTSSLAHNVPSDPSPKRQNSVWVGNLAFKTTEQALRAFFKHKIPGCEITRVNLPTKSGRRADERLGGRNENRGFAYIDFTTINDKEKAIAVSEQNLDGRKLLIKDGDDFTGRPTSTPGGTGASPVGSATSTITKSKTARRILAAQTQPPAQTLFMGNLGFQATEKSIREMIERHMVRLQKDISKEKPEEEVKTTVPIKASGILKKVRLATFEDSGHCKGFAFLDFATTEHATSVLLDPRCHHLDGRKLVLEYASADAVRRGGGSMTKASGDELRKKRKVKEVLVSENSNHRDTESTEFLSKEKMLEKEEESPAKRRKREDGRQQADAGRHRRTKPGAALALAQREKVAIVPSSGKKIVF